MKTNGYKAPRGERRVLAKDSRRKSEARVQRGFRIRASLSEYISSRGGDAHGAATAVVESAVGLHKALAERLEQHRPRLQQWALDAGLDFSVDEFEVYARLILRGLEEPAKKLQLRK